MPQSVGARLAQLRRVLSVILDRDVRQDEMAEITGFSAAVWSHWETDRRSPSRSTAQQIVERLRPYGMDWLTVSWLDYGEGSGPPVLGKPGDGPTKPTTKRHGRDVTPGRKKKEA